jgi:hypothetical protein
MMRRQRSPYTVDVTCAHCAKPMMMLKFNYTTLERGFESISLRCQYCKAEETRPWPRKEEDVAQDQQETAVVADGQPPPRTVDEVVTDAQPSDTVEAVTDEPEPIALSDDTRLSDVDASSTGTDATPGVDDQYERMRMRFAIRPPLPPEVSDAE